MSGRDVNVYGAGMSGMVAAINLAREGYSVTVLDIEPGYGGSSLFNPSTHVTPIDPVATSEYIGIDVSAVFHQLAYPLPFYFHDTKVVVPPEGFYAIERGNRETSLDTLLYGECLELGVRFAFESPLRKQDLSSLPPGTIIACGLTPAAYEMLDIPHLRWYGWISRGRSGVSNFAWTWWDECVSEYGYFSSTNEYYFDLLFSTRKVDKECLRRYSHFMVRNEGIEHESWEHVTGVVPLGSPDNPKLFSGDLILCGTIAGSMDPWFWFGISGALITGKIAAMAVSDRDAAIREFERFTKRYRHFYRIKNWLWYPFVRPRVGLIEKSINAGGIPRANRMNRFVVDQVEKGHMKVPLVPGFGRYNYYRKPDQS